MANGLVNDSTNLIQCKGSCLITAYCSSWSHCFTWREPPHLFKWNKIKSYSSSCRIFFYINICINIFFIYQSFVSHHLFHGICKPEKNCRQSFTWKVNGIYIRIHTLVLLPMGVPRAQQQLKWSPVDKHEKNHLKSVHGTSFILLY